MRKKLLAWLCVLFFSVGAYDAHASPVVNVSIESQTVLLGAQATYEITISNTGPDKGYNLTLGSIFGSSRDTPEGQVTFSSASDKNGAPVYSSQSIDADTGESSITFGNIQDLAPGEEYTMILTVDLSGDSSWEGFDDLILDTNVSLDESPEVPESRSRGLHMTSPAYFPSHSAARSLCNPRRTSKRQGQLITPMDTKLPSRTTR